MDASGNLGAAVRLGGAGAPIVEGEWGVRDSCLGVVTASLVLKIDLVDWFNWSSSAHNVWIDIINWNWRIIYESSSLPYAIFFDGERIVY